MFKYDNRVVVITGASSGLGRQMAEGFASNGASLAVLARRVERLEELKKELEEKYHVEVLPVQCDVTDSDSINTAAEEVEKHFGKVDVLINCAGSSKDTGALEMTCIYVWTSR